MATQTTEGTEDLKGSSEMLTYLIPRGKRKFYQTVQGSGQEDIFRTETLRARNKFHLEHASVHKNI